MPTTWLPTVEISETVANRANRSSACSSDSTSSTPAPGAVHPSVMSTSVKLENPRAGAQNGASSAMHPTMTASIARPAASSPRARVRSLSSTRCISRAWSRPSTVTTIKSWYSAMAAESEPNPATGSVYASTGETTTAAIICIDQMTTYSIPRPNRSEACPREAASPSWVMAEATAPPRYGPALARSPR